MTQIAKLQSITLDADGYYEEKFRLHCFQKTRDEFQKLFDLIMQEQYKDYISARPDGKQGDWKCDGHILSSGTFFQCYSPDNATDGKTSAKIKKDFDGCLSKWQEHLKTWIFVYAFDDSLKPNSIKSINEIKAANPGLSIETWGRQHLWNQIKILSDAFKKQLLGPPLLVSDAKLVTSVEIAALFKYLHTKLVVAELNFEDIDRISLSEKFEKNKFSDYAKNLIISVLPISKLVKYYIDNHPDPEYSLNIVMALKDWYESATAKYDGEAFAILEDLSGKICGDLGGEHRYIFASLGIVAYYFELCEVFEK